MTARKHDGFRILARKDGNRVKLITRNGYDFADRYPLIVDGIASLPMETCIIDGEATVVDQNGLLVFDLLCYRQHDHAATLWTFDLLELDGADLRLSDLHRPMTPRPVQHGGGSNWTPCSTRPEPPSVLRVRAGCGGHLFTAKLAVVVHYLSHQLLDHLLTDDPILLARQFCDCLRDRINNFICFRGIGFV